MNGDTFLVINSKILPPVFAKVLAAKKMLADGTASNVSKAVKMVDISRSAFYKYKDYVFEYDEKYENTVNLSAVLSDKAGVFSGMTALLYKHGANITTINQMPPVNGTARVLLTVRTDNIKISLEELLNELRSVNGIISVKSN